MDFLKIIWALALAYFIWRILPATIHNLKHGPRGSNNDWLVLGGLLGGVMLFVWLLIRFS